MPNYTAPDGLKGESSPGYGGENVHRRRYRGVGWYSLSSYL